MTNYSKQWITWLVGRWRAQPTAWINVNCRTPWTSTSWTHIAAARSSCGHVWLRVGFILLAIFIVAVLIAYIIFYNMMSLFNVMCLCLSQLIIFCAIFSQKMSLTNTMQKSAAPKHVLEHSSMGCCFEHCHLQVVVDKLLLCIPDLRLVMITRWI